jgi:hypothetical protein
MSGHRERMRTEQKLASAALRHVRIEAVPQVLAHYAQSVQAACDAGRGPDIHAMTDADHDAALASIAEANPHVRRAPDPAPKPLETVNHRGRYEADVERALATKKEK